MDTKGGTRGYGECAPLEESAFHEALAKIKGKDATSYEAIRSSLGNAGPIEAALVTALLDITGKLAKAPVYQVLGGPTRTKARVLGTLGTFDAVEIQKLLKAGYKAIRFPAGASVAETLERLTKLRNEAGNGVDFVVDCGSRFTPGQASSLAAALERHHPLWLDEPCMLANSRAVAKIASESVTPLGFGKSIAEIASFQELLRDQAIDVLRPDIGRMSIARIRRAAAVAETYYTAVAPAHGGGRIGTAAALHLAASIPNFFIADIPLGTATVTNGFAALPTGPGLGITIDEKELG